MRELLIRYLLGELGIEEHDRLHAELQRSPELRAELARLRACFMARQHEDMPAEPPGGLAARVTQQVTGGGDGTCNSLESRRAETLARIAEPPAGMLGWSLADLTVAGGVVLAVSMLLFPALRSSRDGTRLTMCGNNLRVFSELFSRYAEKNHGQIPKVGPREHAGVYASRLVDAEVVSRPEMAVLLVCPAAPEVDRIRAKQFAIEIPTADELQKMPGVAGRILARKISPFYAYTMGYRDDQGEYHQVTVARGTASPILSDAREDSRDAHVSSNHDGYVVQVLFSDGSVRTYRTGTVPGLDDDLFHNKLGKVAAGRGEWDYVLGRSEDMPEPDELSDAAK